jgi:hypothetical protein
MMTFPNAYIVLIKLKQTQCHGRFTSRLKAKWVAAHRDEVNFRDIATLDKLALTL